MADALDPGARREGRVHQDHGGAQLGQAVPYGFRVVAGHRAAGKQVREEAGAGGGDLVQVQRAGGSGAKRKLRHHRQHAGAGGGFEHDVAGADHRGLQCGIGQRQRRRELLILELLLGAPGLGGFQRRQGLQHAEHGGGAAGTGAGLAAHGAAVALEEQHQRRLRRLVGILPEPAALGVGSVEGIRHGVPEGRGIERLAGLQDRQQSAGRGQQCGGRGGGLRRSRFGDRGDGDGGRARGGGRRRVGVEHGAGSDDGVREGRRDGAGRTLHAAPSGLPSAGWPASFRRGARWRSRSAGRPRRHRRAAEAGWPDSRRREARRRGGKRSGRRAAGDQVRAAGSTQRESSLAGRLTSVLTGWAVMSSAG